MKPALIELAAALNALWGIAHLFAVKGVVKGFGELKPDNRRIITMEWIVEGIFLISIAAFVTVAAAIAPASSVSYAVYTVAIGALVILAVVSLFTGFRVAFLPFRLCPVIFSVSALLIAWGAWF